MKKENKHLNKLLELIKMAISNTYERSLSGDRSVKCLAYPEDSFFDYLVESFPEHWYTDVYRVFLDDDTFTWQFESNLPDYEIPLEMLLKFLDHA